MNKIKEFFTKTDWLHVLRVIALWTVWIPTFFLALLTVGFFKVAGLLAGHGCRLRLFGVRIEDSW